MNDALGLPIGPIEAFMTEDHVALDRTLGGVERAGAIDEDGYRRFRGGLLRHIAMEEKVLLPFVRAKTGAPFRLASQLHADHGALAKLLVRSPSGVVLDALRRILSTHNGLEEGDGGLYATCDALAVDEASTVVERLRAQPEVPLAPYYDGPPHVRGGVL